MIILLYIYLVIGIIVTSVMLRVATLGVSSEKLNLNKYDILAIKLMISVGMTVAYPIVILLVILGRDNE